MISRPSPELMDTPENLYDWVGAPYGGKRRRLSREFKRHAVQMVTEKGMSVGKVARELDIHPNLLHLRRRKLLAEEDRAFVRKGHVTREEATTKGLRIITAQASSCRATILLQRLIISNFLMTAIILDRSLKLINGYSINCKIPWRFLLRRAV